MRRLISLGVGLVSLALLAQPSKADFVFGPFPDFVGTLTVSASVTVNTRFHASLKIPFDGTFNIDIRDRIQAKVSVTVPVFAASYVTVASSSTTPFNQNTDMVTITDIYAFNKNPTGNPNTPSLTGFLRSNPQFSPLGPEQFIGTSGTVYTAGVSATSTLAALPGLLPGFNLSAFSGGDPGSIVFVERTTVPAVDAIPEPGSLTLLSLGAVSLAGYGWRRKTARPVFPATAAD
jgi:hypothetical protein